MKVTHNNRNRFNLRLTKAELELFNIAIANLDIADMEEDAKEHGLDLSTLEYNHYKLFSQISEITGLYPAIAPKSEGEEQWSFTN